MKERLTREMVRDGLREDIATCLAIETDDIADTMNFFYDLDGESIDLLDIGFRSDRRFGIQSKFQRLTAADGWKFDSSGRLTAETLQWLASEFPRIDWTSRLGTVAMQSARDALTIDLMVELIYDAQFETTTSKTV
jgi:acyl carrier protein